MNEQNVQDKNGEKPVSEMSPEELRRAFLCLVDGIRIDEENGKFIVRDNKWLSRSYSKRAWAEKYIDREAKKYESLNRVMLLCQDIQRERKYEELALITTAAIVEDDRVLVATVTAEFRIYMYLAEDEVPYSAESIPDAPDMALDALSRLALAALQGGAK